MAKALIKNLTATPIGLPPPFSGVLPGGGATVVDIGNQTVNAVAEQFTPLMGGGNVVEFVEVPTGSPVGPITQALSAAGIADALAASTAAVSFNGQKLSNVGTPTVGTDAATKSYVDSTAGGTGTVTSIAAGNGLSASPGSPITTTGTLSVSFLGANAAGGSGLAGGNSTLYGGNGNGVGAGGNSTVQGGAGGATDAAGGVATLQGGGGGGTNGSGGSAFVRGGQKQGTGTDGAVYVGDVYTDSVTVGATAKPIYVNGIISSPVAVSNDGGSPQQLTNVTPGTTDVVALPTTPIKAVDVAGASSPLTLDATTPIVNGTVNGQTFRLFNTPGSSGTFKIPSGGNVFAEFTAGTLDFPPGTIAEFMWIGGFNKWLQISKAVTISP